MEMHDAEIETTSVIICGCGPTGAMLSAYLSRYHVSNIVLEREPEITTDPRGIALDEDGIRLMQGLGFYDKIYTEIGQCMGKFNFITGTQHNLHAKPLMALDYSTSEGGTGHVGFICHKQPVLEKYLREAAISQPSTSEIRTQAELSAISEDQDWVYVEYLDADGHTYQLRSNFLVGADGKTGFVRKKYLEPKGVRLEQVSETSYEEVWVAMNWRMTLPTPETHPNFPLWKLGYTPEDVYDAFFPKDFRFLCNPSRPSVCGRFGLHEDRLWRFEYVVRKEEDGDEMAKPERVKEIVWPYLRHPASQYGLTEAISFPEDCVEVIRCRPFRFNARSCNMWTLNRTILVGDAAHVFPPFGGQGIASGFRDASGLAWRLAIASQPDCPDFRGLFRAWEHERKQQLKRSLATTIRNGEYVNESNPIKVALRDWHLWCIQLVPSWKRALEKGPRAEMIKYQHAPGLPFLPEMDGGISLPQVYCRHLFGSKTPVQFTDDVIFSAKKTGLFQILVLIQGVEDLQLAHRELSEAQSVAQGTISASEVTFLLHRHPGREIQFAEISNFSAEESTYCIVTAEEFVMDGRLCIGRQQPRYYDEHRLWKEFSGKKYLIVRPDRFVFAACNSERDLRKAFKILGNAVHSSTKPNSSDNLDKQNLRQPEAGKV